MQETVIKNILVFHFSLIRKNSKGCVGLQVSNLTMLVCDVSKPKAVAVAFSVMDSSSNNTPCSF